MSEVPACWNALAADAERFPSLRTEADTPGMKVRPWRNLPPTMLGVSHRINT
jgi:hypothetical protein